MKTRRDIIKESPHTRVRRKKFHRKILIIGIVFVLLVGATAYLTHLPFVQIKEIKVEGNILVEERDVIEVTNEVLSGRYLHIFSRSNSFIFPKEELEFALMDRVKRISELDIEERNGVITIHIKERGGQSLWCGDELPTSSSLLSNECYYVDSNAFVFSRAPFFSDNLYFKFYGTGTINTTEPIGSYVLPTEEFNKLILFKEDISKYGVVPQGIYMNENGDHEILLERGISNQPIPPRILFNKSHDLEKVHTTIGTALTSEPLLSLLKEKYDKLEYLDVRFENKVFYKFSE